MTDPDGGQATPTGGGYRFQWRDGVIALLLLLLAGAGWLALRDRQPERPDDEPGVERVGVFDVVVDREERRWLEVIFDRAVLAEAAGEGDVEVGDVLALPAATVEPALGGAWRWRDRHVLRFEPSGGFQPATEYRFALVRDRVLRGAQRFRDGGEFTVRVDRFLVERVDVLEEPAPDGKGVLLRGTVSFNYAVDPELLAGLIRLDDPRATAPIEVQLEAGWRTEQIPFRTPPLQKEKEPRDLRLTIAGELTPAAGNVPLEGTFVHIIPLGSSEVLEVREARGEPALDRSVIRIVLSSAVAADLAGPYVKVEPATDYRLTAERNALLLTGDFAPGRQYRVEVGKGLPAQDGAVLRETWEAQLRLSNLPESVDFQSQGTFLSRAGLRNLAIETVNVNRVRLAIDRVYRNNLFYLLQWGDEFNSERGYYAGGVAHSLGDRLVDKTIAIDGGRNAKITTVVSLDEHIDSLAPGLYRVAVSRPDYWEAPQRWLLVTDLGAVAKQGQDEFLLWAVSHRTLRPIAGARVELVSDQNQTIARGTTDAEGFWRVRDAAALAEQRPFLVTLVKGEDFSFVYLDRMRIDTTGLDVGGGARAAGGYSAFVYGERDLYRPGETVRGVALVRDRNLRPAPEMPVLLRLRDPSGRELERRALELDRRGLVEFDWQMPAYALTGRQSLELEIAEEVVGRYGFQLEEFVPDRIKVEIRPASRSVAPGEALAYEVGGNYLFGPPAAGLGAETRVRLIDSTFVSRRHPTFTFRDPDRSFSDREIFRDQSRLDDAGQASFEVELPPEREVPSALEAVVTARVQEQGGRGVTALVRLGVDPYPYFLGLRRPDGGYPDLGQAVSFDWVAVTPGDADAEAGRLEARLILDRWQTVLRRTPSGSFRYESTRDSVTVARQEIAAGRSAGTITFTPHEYGSHRVVLTDPATGASTSVQFYTGGWGYSPWAVENPDRLELELDRDEYAPGDVATLQVRSPFPGRLLVTVERDGIDTVRTFDLAGNTATLRLPVRGEWRPNAYVTATLVRAVEAIEPGSVGRAYGAVPIAVDRAANRLSVTIEAPEEIRSGSRLEVGVTAPRGAAVTIAAVDEGILQLIAQRTPDPFEFFYRKLRLGVSSFDTFSLLLPEIEAPRATGGGEGPGAAAQYVRTDSMRRVRPVAFWSGVIEADAAGSARAAFELPEFAGAVRLMAVAAAGDRFGSADSTTRVRDPLVLTPTLPRILSFGETLEIPVTLRNDTGRPGRFELALTVTGAAAVDGEPGRAIEIPNAAERTVYFAVKSGLEEGSARFTLEARGNGESARATVEVGVRPDLPPQAESVAGALTEATTELAASDGRFRPGSVTRDVRIGQLPLVRFGGQLAQLLRYPYGCLEQILSGTFPLIYLEELAREFEPELLDPERGGAAPADLIDETLRRVAYHQVPGGGFALWRGGSSAHPWSSLYTGHYLVEAERAGHPVDPQLVEGSLDYARRQARAEQSYGAEDLERTAYALYVLARAGQAELGVMDFVRDRHANSLLRSSRALLAAAYASVGNRDAVGELIAGIEDVERVERGTGQNFRSVIRDRALLLLALLDAEPDSARIPALVERLGRDAAEIGAWNTQETAFTLIALGQLVRRQAERAPFAGTVWAGSQRLGRFTSDETAHFKGVTGGGPIKIVVDGGYEPGAAFYSVTTRGVLRDAAFQPSAEGLEVERLLLGRDGAAIDPAAVTQGDLIVVKTRVRSTAGAVANVVVQQLLPSGLEVENPRLATTESLPWVSDANLQPASLDLRDDRVLIFTDLPANRWQNLYSLVRAVAPGSFRLPPVHAEAMYNPALRATGPRGMLTVGRSE